ncbi:hypothetical protein, variant 2 [Cladophialophora immunda]|uniref:Uncharacterized protein n=1 Tax=Cladophialophora immunda TaxID=569365 RepID=A0A0D2C5T6_9EURO|nr:hypothetical protein, variant 1 [Cladophialophora immunda]XP_016246066.1 hypothetical protein, variant 2 [Cladophialophora immunda]KIW25849.1 hypothetical protein, variant 1 [Cladophialophora immunda]KIW25850.1 hypothetical protein, variant 2 [Cladophialophora immunda]
MPIKLPKGFQRRKSSGHALDEVRNPPGEASSFRVLERPASKGKSFDGGRHLKMASVGGAPLPPPKDQYDHEEVDLFAVGRPDASNRGSGGTERSHSTAPNDSAASSARLSTSSTNPSSIDTRSDKNVQGGAGARPFNDIPAPPPATTRPGFLRSPVRTFSFGVVKGSRASPTSPSGALPPLMDTTRNRAVTSSTASTATPPRLFDTDLSLESSELDEFGNMFDHIGSSPDAVPSRLIHQEASIASPPAQYPPTSYPGASPLRISRAPPPKPISIDHSQVVESSPYSWASHDSNDHLMRSPSPSKTITQGSPMKAGEAGSHPGRYGSMSESTVSAKGPGGSTSLSQEEELQPSPFLHTRSPDSNMASTSPARDGTGGLSPSSTHSATFDPIIAADAQLASMYQETRPVPVKSVSMNKVMTPAQWERYKEQKEMDRRLGALSDDSASEASENSDDDDEIERSRQATKQRRKQEAHLAVYRQKMMKVTGEAPPNRSMSSLGMLRPGDNNSSPDLNRLSRMTLESKQSGKSSGEEEEEDEDVPLGILAAHGFPNKNRPPTRLANSPSNSNLRSVSQNQGAPSVISQAPKGGNLPVFARQLPPDPYYGASLVNPSNREALGLHPAGPPPQGVGPATAHPIHPAGLVGVIAGEERARAARRGSPNPAGNYDLPPMMGPPPGMVRSQTTGTLSSMAYPPMGAVPPMPGMAGMPGMPPMLSAGDQAQIQMSQQMTQMMQMQMQWMQQMSNMMVGPMNAPPNLPPPGPQNPAFARPQSLAMQNPPPLQANQRTMSTLNPSMAPWNSKPPLLPSINVNGNYAPSIAPSERSNIGLASRYRPVSIAPEPDVMSTHRRASTFTSTTARPWSTMDQARRPSAHATKPSVNTLGRRSPLANPDDEDDEQGWAEMKMKKDKKQKTWALRKGQNALSELYANAS